MLTLGTDSRRDDKLPNFSVMSLMSVSRYRTVPGARCFTKSSIASMTCTLSMTCGSP